MISVLPMVLLFGSGLLTKQDLLRLDWSLVVLLGGGFCLGAAVSASGALALLGDGLKAALSDATLQQRVAVFNLVIISISNFVSHSVTAVTLLPVIAATASGTSAVAAVVVAAAIADSGACLLPISSIPNLIVAAATDEDGVTYLKMRDFLKIGVVMLLIAYGLTTSVTFGVSRLVLKNACPLEGGLLPPPAPVR